MQVIQSPFGPAVAPGKEGHERAWLEASVAAAPCSSVPTHQFHGYLKAIMAAEWLPDLWATASVECLWTQ